jgi:hypothetical protein
VQKDEMARAHIETVLNRRARFVLNETYLFPGDPGNSEVSRIAEVPHPLEADLDPREHRQGRVWQNLDIVSDEVRTPIGIPGYISGDGDRDDRAHWHLTPVLTLGRYEGETYRRHDERNGQDLCCSANDLPRQVRRIVPLAVWLVGFGLPPADVTFANRAMVMLAPSATFITDI